MEITAEHRYFWERQPSWVNRLALGSLIPAAALALVFGGLTYLAWRLADADGPVTHYSLNMHVIAMLAVSTLAVGVASALVVQRKPVLAGLVLIATAFGPMTIVATPVKASLVTSNSQDTQMWWHAVVAAVVAVLLSGWTWWVVRCLPKTHPSNVPAQSSLTAMLPDLVFIVTAGSAVLAYLSVPVQSNEPAMRAIIGWAVLAAGIVTSVGFAKRWWTSFVAAGAVGVVLGLVFLAYSRDGGWPGVAGWEYNGMASPIITSVASTAVLLTAWMLGLAVWGLRSLAAKLVPSHTHVRLMASITSGQ